MTPGDDVMNRYIALPTIRKAQIDWLRSKGVPTSAIANPDALVTGEVAFTGSRFDFADETSSEAVLERAVIVLLREAADNCPLDLGAWAPRSGNVGTWAGRVSFAGDAFGPRLHDGGALPVHTDFLAWLADEREGIVILDPTQACRELADFGGPFLATGGVDHARALLNILTPPKPRVFVARAEQLEPT